MVAIMKKNKKFKNSGEIIYKHGWEYSKWKFSREEFDGWAFSGWEFS